MEAYIKESIYVLDYQDNVVDAIYISDDHRTPGYAYSINVEEANTGYSNLTFTMPNYINDEDGNAILNPRMKLLTPLVKLRYRREVYYTGIGDKAEINVNEPINLGEYGIFQQTTYPRPGEPDGLIEDYVMDYIVQPTQKNRNNLEISTQFTAIDYPRFNLSKKHFGLTFAEGSVTRSDWSIYDKTPMSSPGTIQYIQWDASKYGRFSTVEVWDPANASGYPLNEDQLNDLLEDTGVWSYGVSSTAFYWPIVSTARYEGTLYNENDYLILNIFPKMLGDNITDPDIIETTLDRYTCTWNQLEQNRWYLTPNNATNYLLHILDTTNWSINSTSDRYDGTYVTATHFTEENREAGIRALLTPAPHNVEHYVIVKEFKNLDGQYKGTVSNIEDLPSSSVKDDRYFLLTFDENNKIINTEMYVWDGTRWYKDLDDKDYCRTSFWTWDESTSQFIEVTNKAWTSSIDKKTGVLYDVDPIETEVATPDGAIENYEVTEYTGYLNLSDSNCYNAITALCKEFQLYPIFDCINRKVSLKQFAGKNYGLTYRLGSNIASTGVKADGEKVITKLRCYGGVRPDGSEQINLGDAERRYKQLYTGEFDTPQDLPTSEVGGYWALVDNGESPVYSYDNTSNLWSPVQPNEKGEYWVTVGNESYNIDLETGLTLPWNPNDPAYIQERSPYGTEYIYNFKWMYDNNWMTKQQILDFYALNKQINDKNKTFLATYTENFNATNAAYVQATVDYDTFNGEFQACLNSMANTYYKIPTSPGEGKFTAFPYAPLGTELRSDGHGGQKYYAPLYHCYACGYTHKGTVPNGPCPNCGKIGYLEQKYLYIPVFDDFTTTSERTKPQSKGFYQALLEQLGTQVARENISIVDKIPTQRIDGLTDEVSYIINGQVTYDKSANMYNWNDYVERWQDNYGPMLDNLRNMEELLQRCEDLETQYNIYAGEIQKIEDEIQDRFGDYIVEGKYKDEEVAYEAILMNKALEASDKYAIPEITYNLNVIDTTGMIEYRWGVPDECNDVVRLLHNAGQIVPHPGDYCSIYDEHMGLVGVPGLITNIKRVLDDPKSNSITLDTAYHDADELVGNIINATNTVLNHSDVYARTAILNTDGTIAGSALSDSLEKSSSENVSLIGVKGSSLLDSTGLVVSDPKDANRKLKYAGAGVYSTVDNGVTWLSMMTPDGVNANYINAGSIDTKNVQIMSGRYGKVVLDNLGLSVKDNAMQTYSLPTTKDSDNFWDWSTTNLNAFIGVNRENEGLLYLKGQMQVTGGSKIGNWVVGTNDLYNVGKTIYLSPGGVQKTILNNTDLKTFVAGNNFAVTTGGKLLATGADITGKIVITDTNSEMNKGTIGGWTSTDNGLKNAASGTTLVLSPAGGAITGTVHSSGSRSDWGIFMNSKFGVTTSGDLYASNATISGNITATTLTATDSGKIGPWIFNDEAIYNGIGIGTAGSTGLGNYTDWAFWANNGVFRVAQDGYLYASNANIAGTIDAGSGYIGGWEINNSSITGGTTTLNKNGKISFSKGDAFFAMGDSTEHPRASSINVKDYISFRKKELSVDSTADEIGRVGTEHANGLVMASNDANDINIVGGGTVRLRSNGGDANTGIAVYNSVIYADSDMQFNGAIRVGSNNSGKSCTVHYEDTSGLISSSQTLVFMNGILVSASHY